MNSVQSRERSARNAALTLSGLVAIASVIALFSYHMNGVDVVPRGPYIALLLVGTACLLATSLLRKLSVYSLHLISLASLATAGVADVTTNVALAHLGIRYEPFLGSKFIGLAIALIGFSPIRLGYVIIVLCGLYPVSAYYLLIPPEFRINVAVPEPWTTVFFAIISLAVLAHRHREFEVQRQLVQANTERNEAQKQALKFLAIRDLSNTPLQAIEISCFLLKEEFPEASELVHQIDKSLLELNKLDRILSSYAADMKWENRDVSLNAASILERTPENGD